MSDEKKLSDDKLGPPPVDPMSDVAWARVERGLWSRIDSGASEKAPEPPKRRWLWIAAPSFALAAVFALLFATGLVGGSRSEPAVITVVDPVEPSRVVAGTAPTAVSFGDAHIDLAAESAIVLNREGDSPSVLLERGTASFAVAPRADRPPFVVRAGDTVVRVVGTKFSVARSEELIKVAVEHGLVDVQFRGSTHRVGAGQVWSSDAPGILAALEPTPSPVPERTAVVAPPEPIVTTPARDAIKRTPPRTGSAAPRTTPPTTTTTAKDLDGATYDRLSSLERRDPAAALAGYLELSKGNSKWSAVALYAAGRLAADRNDRRAATFLDIYLRRFPNGANAEDARNLLARLKGDAP